MKRVLAVGLFALPILLSTTQSASAQVPGGCSYLGCGGFCFRFLGSLHQHGPLFNYGPYSGYYPFEPYGPWTSDLRYNGPTDCGGRGCGRCGSCASRLGNLGWKRGGDCDSGGCGSWGGYAKSTWKNVFHRMHPLAHKSGHDCPSCGGEAAPASAGCAGCAAAAVAAFIPAAMKTEEPVLQTGYPRRER